MIYPKTESLLKVKVIQLTCDGYLIDNVNDTASEEDK